MAEEKIFLTAKGLKKLYDEIEKLEKEYADVSKGKMEAAEQGGNLWHDNPAFDEVEQRQRLLGRQIAELKEKIRQSVVIREMEGGKDIVAIGSTVEVVFVDGKTITVTIGGHGEADPAKGIISYESPIGTALLGSKVGDVCEYRVGDKTFSVTIKNILVPAEK